ncbi:hypothetical protein F4678DRAFT_257794 [Xylaria arbuscula]|nr:hypothetical protein F4678DRAFT_257794 [Xylaria arbuscula]
MTTNQQNTTAHLAPYRPSDQMFDLPVRGVTYYPDHPFTQQLNQACSEDELDKFKAILAEWCRAEDPSPPRGPSIYPMAPVEPCFYHAIRLDRSTFVALMLDQGVLMCHLAASVAIEYKCSTAMWEVFLDNGMFDLNVPFSRVDPPPLAFVLHNEELVRWLLAHGADPNVETSWGLTPFLKAVGHAPLSIVKLLHEAGGSIAIAVPFACMPSPSRPPDDDRLEVLRYLLDLGADPNAPKWAHNRNGRHSDFDWGSTLNAVLANGRSDLAEELLHRGARTDFRSFNIASRDETALEIAARRVPSIVPLIEECRAREKGDTEGRDDQASSSSLGRCA